MSSTLQTLSHLALETVVLVEGLSVSSKGVEVKKRELVMWCKRLRVSTWGLLPRLPDVLFRCTAPEEAEEIGFLAIKKPN